MRFLRGANSHPAWVVVAVLLMIVGPFIAILMPAFLSVSTFQYSSRISYIPLPTSFHYYIWAFVLFSIGLVLIYFISKKSIKITSGILAFCLFAFLFFTGVNQYHYFDKDYIEVGGIYDKKQYSWSEVKEAAITIDANEFRSLRLTMEDSNHIEILLAGVVTSQVEMSIKNRLIANDVEIEYED